MKIIYTSHLEFRLHLRSIPKDLPRKAFQLAKEHYYDSLTRHYVAIHQVEYETKIREMAIIYDRGKDLIEIITAHPLKPYQKSSRIKSGRWRKI